MIKKADIILLILIVAAGLIISFDPLAKKAGGTDVRVTLDGDTYGIYSLAEDRTITIEKDGHTNVIVIEDGTVHMESSTCKNQICVHEGEVTAPGQLIVCLPNYVIVEIEGGEGSDEALDAIAQ